VVLAAAAGGAAAETKATQGARDQAWSFGVAGERHNLKAGNGHELIGNAGKVQLGTGWIHPRWYGLVSLDVALGPYEPTYGGQHVVDYVGTGLTTWLGFSAQTLDLRSKDGGYGFALGLSYGDIVGRSTGRNLRDAGGERNPDLVDDYTMHVTDFSLMPAVFFSWLRPARPAGNTPELLATRVEGYVLTLGMEMPLLVTYQAKFQTRERKKDDGSIEPAHAETASGQLRGYSILVALTALLGT
jgi:hypothetical protein